MLKKILALACAASMLGGCATRGAITIDCPKFRTVFVRDVPDPEIISVIHGDSLTDKSQKFNGELFTAKNVEDYLTSDSGKRLMATMKEPRAQKNENGTAKNGLLADPLLKEPVVLLLSGGGQWGAYGASFLNQLQNYEPSRLPKFVLVTGVSTGAIQALYVSAEQAKRTPEGTETQLAALQRQYSPIKESEIVDRGSLLGAVFSGSVAGLKPLRKRIEDALCPLKAKRELTCPLIDALADPGAPPALIGFVDAKSGKMQFVDIKDIALHRGLSNTEKQQCITGATMASAAVPFFYQQVRIASDDPDTREQDIKPRTYYDGGVRQSVFFAFTDSITKAAMEKTGWKPTKAEQTPPRTIFMVRNGPTFVRTDGSPDTKADGITAASRGYQLLVNQSEITSLAAIRPLFPKADIFLTTADGHEQSFADPAPELGGQAEYTGGCRRTEESLDRIFDPQFMTCLRASGRHKAKKGWIKLPDPKAN